MQAFFSIICHLQEDNILIILKRAEFAFNSKAQQKEDKFIHLHIELASVGRRIVEAWTSFVAEAEWVFYCSIHPAYSWEPPDPFRYEAKVDSLKRSWTLKLKALIYKWVELVFQEGWILEFDLTIIKVEFH